MKVRSLMRERGLPYSSELKPQAFLTFGKPIFKPQKLFLGKRRLIVSHTFYVFSKQYGSHEMKSREMFFSHYQFFENLVEGVKNIMSMIFLSGVFYSNLTSCIELSMKFRYYLKKSELMPHY